MITGNDMSNLPATADEDSNLALGLERDACNLTGKFRSNDVGRGDFALVEAL
jgi:hypothetical protein